MGQEPEETAATASSPERGAGYNAMGFGRRMVEFAGPS